MLGCCGTYGMLQNLPFHVNGKREWDKTSVLQMGVGLKNLSRAGL